jgi:hypothetical protein
MCSLNATPTIIRDRCGGCGTPWELDTQAHLVTYRPHGRRLQVGTAEPGTGDDSWTCPVAVGGSPLSGVGVPVVDCGRQESHDADEDWGTWL